ncbi:MAG: hypothetical protein N3A65_09545 [candidate division WOR-3 bacterium]|nr:hypothetical protein [candidate division WOR-3 bacterium]
MLGGPNPNDQINSNYQTSLKIYDPTGRMIKSFNLESCIMNRASPSLLSETGQASVIWDGTDDSGRKLPSGVYFVRLEAGNYRRIEKVVLVR